jgi:hypothetical protein
VSVAAAVEESLGRPLDAELGRSLCAHKRSLKFI